MDLLRSFEDAGLAARSVPSDLGDADALLEVGSADRVWIFAVEEKRRAPYPNEVDDMESRRTGLALQGEPLLVAPVVTEGTGDTLSKAGWSWADLEGNLHLEAPGLFVHRRQPRRRRKVAPQTLPQGTGGLSIIRALLEFVEGEAEPPDATGLARRAGVTQPRASQVLGRLTELGLIEKRDRRWWPNREHLLDRFLSEYRGPGGSESYYYSLAEPSEVAVRITKGTQAPYPFLVSADVGPDVCAPWMRPRVLIVYSRADSLPRYAGLVEAIGKADANVIVRHPSDRSVFANPGVGVLGADEFPLANVPQMIWDLEDLGGSDRIEAAGVLRTWFLNR